MKQYVMWTIIISLNTYANVSTLNTIDKICNKHSYLTNNVKIYKQYIRK